MKLTNANVFETLELVESTKDKGLHQKKFVDFNGKPITNSSTLISYLLRHDLVETDSDEEIYFLTDVGYNTIEEGSWFDPDLAPPIFPKKKRALSYSSGEEKQSKNNKKPYLSSLRAQGLVLSLFVALFSYIYVNAHTIFGNTSEELPNSNQKEEQVEVDGDDETDIKGIDPH